MAGKEEDDHCWGFLWFLYVWVLRALVRSMSLVKSGSCPQRQPWALKSCLSICLLPHHSQDHRTTLGLQIDRLMGLSGISYNARFPTKGQLNVGPWLLVLNELHVSVQEKSRLLWPPPPPPSFKNFQWCFVEFFPATVSKKFYFYSF